MSEQSKPSYQFGSFRINPTKRLLFRAGKPLALPPKSFDTLLTLIEHHGEVVDKDCLMKTVWPETIVEENNLTQQISMLRRALGERVGEHRYVVTVPGRGYTFVADVCEVNDAELGSIVQHNGEFALIGAVNNVAEDQTSMPGMASKQSPVGLIIFSSKTVPKLASLLGAVLLVSIALLLSFSLSSKKSARQNRSEAKKSIAVLPFKSLNDDPAIDYLGTGMTDTLIAKLTNLRQIAVRPTSSVLSYSATITDAQQAGRELGVDSVLEGTVQTVGDRVRLTVQLVRVEDRNLLWGQSFSEEVTDIFSVQDAISERVAQTMLVELNVEEEKLLKKRDTHNVEAYQEYLKGRFFWNQRNEESLRKSIEHFNRAIALDPSYGKAYAGLADSLIVSTYYGDKAVSYEDARAAAEKALVIDDTLAEAHTSLALIKSVHDHDEEGAQNEFKRALQLNPNYATAHHWYSDYLAMRGRHDEAIVEIKRAQELDPVSPIINTSLGEQLFYLRQYDEAVKHLRRTLEMAPDFGPAHYILGLVFEQKGMYDEAISELKKARDYSGVSHGISSALGHTYAVAGHRTEARRILDQLLAKENPAPYEVAMVYQGLGERQQAVKWLQRIEMKTDGLGGLMRVDPRLDGLRSDPIFKQLMQQEETLAS